MAKTRIVLLHKPYGVVSQFSRLDDKTTLSRYGLPALVYPAGRLDHDSEGLLLLTDDGGLARRLTDPRFGHTRTYWVQVERAPDDETLARLAKGVALTDGKTLPCRVRRLEAEPDLPPRDPPIRVRLNVPTAWLELTLKEGRNRQVRRMTAAIGHPTLRLVRAAIGRLTLGGLAPGQWRWVNRAEL
ncbi:MAG TPA: pseudouridine synthase [Elusimicrobia bacterium]|nr:MAG: pseudouridine synthase [Elusimicrobia bacterium GWA2_66_18]OGR69023.1 MAG: pseudouridine synthase [Elusimicrobia bacterium GWC2_65_9]HAZ07070.1 pseudouridine synthase [Elusimicrobiota bacterium]